MTEETKNTSCFPESPYLGHVGHEVVGDAVGVLSDVAAAVGTSGVEVPEAVDGPVLALVALDEILEDFFDHELCAACRKTNKQ